MFFCIQRKLKPVLGRNGEERQVQEEKKGKSKMRICRSTVQDQQGLATTKLISTLLGK
jgi:hypothetical protein